jgi:hypothetical protein
MTSVELSVELAGYTLAGTPPVPASSTPVPAVLMLPGSAPPIGNPGSSPVYARGVPEPRSGCVVVR